MQCPEISAPSPSKIQYEVNSALPTSSKRRRLVSAVWNDFEKVEVDGEHWAICNHCHKRLSGSSKSGTTHLKNHLSRCSALKSSTLWKMAIPMSTSTLNSTFSIETTTINPILNGLDSNIVEALDFGKEWLDNPMRMDNEHSPELTHTSFVSAGASLSLETHEKHAPSTANTELMLTNHWVDNEHSPEITQNSIVFPRASLSFEPQQKHAPSSANVELMVANLSSTSCPEPGPTGHSSFVSAETFSSLELNEKHAPSSANTEFMLASLSSISLLTNVYTASLPRTESSNISKLLAFHKIGAFDYTQQSAAIGRARKRWTKLFIVIWSSRCVALSKQVLGTGRPAKTWKDTVESAQTCVLENRMFLYSPPSSPDFIPSIYSVGGSSGFDDYDLPSVDGMGLRYEQASSFLESMKHSFDDDDLKFFYTDLSNSELQLDLSSAVDNFLSAHAAVGIAQMRWTKLFSVLKWFSICVALKKGV